MATLVDYFNTAVDMSANSGLTTGYPLAQTFTASSSYDVYSIKLLMARTGTTGNITVSLQATDINGGPTDVALASSIVDGNTITLSPNPQLPISEWIEFVLDTTISLVDGTVYAIVFTNSGSDHNLEIFMDSAFGYSSGEDWYYDWDYQSQTYKWMVQGYGDYFFEVYSTATATAETKVRLIPFTYSSITAYVIEIGDEYMKFFLNDALVYTLSGLGDDDLPIVSYQATDLFQIQYAQVGNLMWLVHPKYQPRKLHRLSALAFELIKIAFTKGPFMVRNDLVDPTVSNTATMASGVVNVGEIGTLTFVGESGFFVAGHVGALFKLIHKRPDTTVSQAGVGTSTGIYVKGTFTFTTTTTKTDGSSWDGTVVLQRSENGTDWDDYRTFIGHKTRNVQLSATEDVDNVQYRIYAKAGMTSDFRGDITVDNPLQEGIVRITDISDDTTATIIVIAKLASDAANVATKRWAEGAWSDYRGWPSSITFFEERCVYGGMATVAVQAGGGIV